MRLLRFVPLLICLTPCAAYAADLTKIDRRLVKEPAYQSKEPRYCLLVLGPEARQRVWLVHDQDALFVDLNGNGDLTEPGEKFKAENSNENSASFRVSILGDGDQAKHVLQVDLFKASMFGQEKQGPFVVYLTLAWTGNRSFGAWGDETGLLFFAARPQDAPIIHLDGPLQMGFECHLPLIKKAKDTYELNVGVGTRGLGKRSFGHLKYWNDAVPADAYPTAVLEFPNKVAGAPPVQVEVVLKQRC